MSDTLDYIDSYFTGRLAEAEKRQFEDRCVQDQAFAEEVAFYIQTRQLLKEELLQAKKTAWAPGGPKRRMAPVRTFYLGAAAAAAAVLLFIALYLVIRPTGPSQLAADYIQTHYGQLSQTLDGTRDSLAQGITAYNNRSYTRAQELFSALAHNHPGNTDALLYSGLVYLRQKDYNRALGQFDTLAHIPSLYSNPGPFLKAVTLLQRNAAGDRETARQLLQEVVNHGLDGSHEAAAWLQKF